VIWLVLAALYVGVLIGLAIARYDWLGTIDHKEE
jgi:hypothetical protein